MSILAERGNNGRCLHHRKSKIQCFFNIGRHNSTILPSTWSWTSFVHTNFSRRIWWWMSLNLLHVEVTKHKELGILVDNITIYKIGHEWVSRGSPRADIQWGWSHVVRGAFCMAYGQVLCCFRVVFVWNGVSGVKNPIYIYIYIYRCRRNGRSH